MPTENLMIGQIAQDVAKQVADTETTRKFAALEQQYSQNEQARQTAEAGRVSAEQGRVSAENARVAAEEARATEFAGFEDEIDSKLSKGDFDGTTGVGYSDVSNNWTPYSDESGAFQDNPVISQGTGTDNNVSIVTTGNYAQLREKQGNTVVVNNQIIPKNTTVEGYGLTLVGNSTTQKWTITGTSTFISQDSNFYSISSAFNPIAGHKYLLFTNGTTKWQLFIYGNGRSTEGVQFDIYTPESTGNAGVTIRPIDLAYIINGTQVNESFSGGIIDLTQFFDGNDKIPQDLLDHPDHFFWYYNGSLTYNAGSLENSNGVKLVCTKRNLFNNNYEQGKISQETGEDVSDPNYVRSVDFTRGVPNKPIYVYRDADNTSINRVQYFIYDNNENFIRGGYLDNIGGNNYTKGKIQLGANEWLVKTACVGTLANPPKITISLYYTPEEGGEGYDQHYPYEKPKVYDTGSEVLRSAGSVHDVKVPTGTITRNIITKTLNGTEDWSYGRDLNDYAGFSYNPGNALNDGSVNAVLGIVSNRFVADSGWQEKEYIRLASGAINIIILKSKLSEVSYAGFKSWLSSNNVNVQYALATPTTEQGTLFPESIDIDDYGMMYWLDENDELVGIPQGAKFFYPVSYKGFTDDLYARTDGGAGNVVVQDEIYTKAELDARYALKEALGGTLRQLLAATQSIDFDNTGWIDLGTLNWYYSASNSRFEADIREVPGIKKVNSWNECKNICSALKTGSVDSGGQRYIIGIYGGTIYASYGTETSRTVFQEAMKGVLLAYEKASS